MGSAPTDLPAVGCDRCCSRNHWILLLSASKMTTTATFVGFNDGTKVSSRVLKPPGGECSISFGGDNDDYKPKKTSVGAAPAEPLSTSSSDEAKASPEKTNAPPSQTTPTAPPTRVRQPPGGFSSKLW